MGVAAHLGIDLADYDARIRTFIPDYDVMIEAAAAAVPRGARTIVDLGTGTGTLAARCLSHAPRARIAGIDSDPDILAVAARRLCSHADSVARRRGRRLVRAASRAHPRGQGAVVPARARGALGTRSVRHRGLPAVAEPHRRACGATRMDVTPAPLLFAHRGGRAAEGLGCRRRLCAARIRDRITRAGWLRRAGCVAAGGFCRSSRRPVALV